MNFYCQGRNLLEAGEFFEAEQIFTKGIQEGDIKCHYGILAVNAVQQKDCSEAVEHMKEVFEEILYMAEQGETEACFIAGRCFEMGIVVRQDIERAIVYYEMAAERNHADALFNLGCLCMMFGGDKIASAKEYFTKAEFAGSKEAKDALSQMKKDGFI